VTTGGLVITGFTAAGAGGGGEGTLGLGRLAGRRQRRNARRRLAGRRANRLRALLSQARRLRHAARTRREPRRQGRARDLAAWPAAPSRASARPVPGLGEAAASTATIATIRTPSPRRISVEQLGAGETGRAGNDRPGVDVEPLLEQRAVHRPEVRGVAQVVVGVEVGQPGKLAHHLPAGA